jgi:hypothetical protein
VTAAAIRVYRLMLLLHPAEFRRSYGDDMVAQPIASASSSRRWMRWMRAGGLAIVAAVAIPAIDGGELNEVWWTVTAIALLSGIGMAVTAVVLAASDRAHRRLAAPH